MVRAISIALALSISPQRDLRGNSTPPTKPLASRDITSGAQPIPRPRPRDNNISQDPSRLALAVTRELGGEPTRR
eukprot:215343-Pyramimonas_sp.AAC.1